MSVNGDNPPRPLIGAFIATAFFGSVLTLYLINRYLHLAEGQNVLKYFVYFLGAISLFILTIIIYNSSLSLSKMQPGNMRSIIEHLLNSRPHQQVAVLAFFYGILWSISSLFIYFDMDLDFLIFQFLNSGWNNNTSSLFRSNLKKKSKYFWLLFLAFVFGLILMANYVLLNLPISWSDP
jgi:hypothetical protein